jgi:hypothetical protein
MMTAANKCPLCLSSCLARRKKTTRKYNEKIILPQEAAVRQVTLDFELARWSAIAAVFPDAEMMGCALHWSQAIWRKV